MIGANVAIVAIVLALAAAWKLTPLSEFISFDRVSAWAREMGGAQWAPLCVILAYTPAALVMLPRQIITLFAVVGFGVGTGLACAAAGILLAALSFYAAGRSIDYSRLRRICGRHLDAVRDVGREHGVMTIFAANMAPVPPFAVKALVAGSLRIDARSYVIGILLSLMPGALTVGAFGHELAGMLESPSAFSGARLMLVAVLIVCFSLLLRHWLRGRERKLAASKRG
jgi:uncharacterized membrane protein YdjX (TVP38/TMEM64 family)